MSMQSTKRHRDHQRLNAASEVAVASLRMLSLPTLLPVKTAQVFNSGYALFFSNPKLKTYERITHGVMMGLSLITIGFVTALLFMKQQCECLNDSWVCLSMFVSELLYQGMLLISWVPAELLKEPAPTPPNTPVRNSPAVRPSTPLMPNV